MQKEINKPFRGIYTLYLEFGEFGFGFGFD